MGGAQRTAVSRGGQTRQGTEFSGSCSTSASGSAARLFAPYVLGRICYLLAGGVAQQLREELSAVHTAISNTRLKRSQAAETKELFSRSLKTLKISASADVTVARSASSASAAAAAAAADSQVTAAAERVTDSRPPERTATLELLREAARRHHTAPSGC